MFAAVLEHLTRRKQREGEHDKCHKSLHQFHFTSTLQDVQRELCKVQVVNHSGNLKVSSAHIACNEISFPKPPVFLTSGYSQTQAA